METATWVTELGVGLACLVVAVFAIRQPRLRAIGVVLLAAGAAAAGHAVFRLVAG